MISADDEKYKHLQRGADGLSARCVLDAGSWPHPHACSDMPSNRQSHHPACRREKHQSP